MQEVYKSRSTTTKTVPSALSYSSVQMPKRRKWSTCLRSMLASRAHAGSASSLKFPKARDQLQSMCSPSTPVEVSHTSVMVLGQFQTVVLRFDAGRL